MASGWNLWVWLQCIGVASRCCYKEVYRYPHNNYNFPYSTCIRSFLSAASLLLCSFLNVFSVFIYIYDEDFSQLYDKCGARSSSPIKRNALRVSKHVTESIQNIARGVGIN